MTTRQLRGAPRRLEAWIFSNAVSRAGLVGATIDDVGKIGYQEDDNTYWRLADYAPVSWLRVGPDPAEPIEGTGDKYYRHVQSSPNTVWVIVHNLEKLPSVSIIDSAGNMTFGQVDYLDGTTLTVTFSAAIGGEAYLN